MAFAFVSRQFVEGFGGEMAKVARDAGRPVEFMTVPEAIGARVSEADANRIDCTFIDRDIRFNDQTNAAYTEALVASKSCRWIHLTSSGVNPAPFMDAMYRNGALVTTSTGSNKEPVAQTGFTGLLMLARGFATYVRGQQAHEWRPLRGKALPDDLRGQTLLLIGVGAVGNTFAGYARAFGLKVIGVRRSAMTPDDQVDELHPPSKLHELLPRADWIVLTCPLTPQTRNLIDADAFRRMKKGARLVNIARGEVVDEAALIEALRSGTLAGAALDAHVREPLPPDSPLWDLPNVIVTPHNASASTGNERRAAEMFLENYRRWSRGESMLNVQKAP
jgi:phosphoglycerate dehydrogenase-like enzyme